jgi:hypothetical protein
MPRLLVSLLLLVLTRDGQLHRFDGAHDSTEPAPRATAVAAFGGQVALLTGARLTVDGRAVPGRFVDARALAAGTQLWVLGPTGVEAVDPRSGKRTPAAQVPGARHVAADGAALFVEANGVVHESGGAHQWTLPSAALAIAAGDGKLWAITRDGQLWEIDRTSGERRALGLGSWSGVLGFAFGDHQLWVATVAGKLWRIDPRPSPPQKTIVAMDGWQGTIDLGVLR